MKSRSVKLTFAILLSVMVLAVILPGAALAEDTPAGEGDSGQSVTAASWSDLQSAINNAPESTVITIEGDLTAQGEDRLLVKGKKLTIDLQGHTLDRQRDSCDTNGHVFEVTDGSEITIKSSTGAGVITGGWADNGGGINVHEGSVCALENITVSGNRADKNGGGICAKGTVNMTDTTVENNRSGEYAGGIYCTGTVNMTGGAVSRNETSDGGGIYNTGTITLSGVAVGENTVKKDGGAGVNNKGNATLTDCEIMNNACVANGGGIYSEDTLTVSGGKVSANAAKGGAGINVETGSANLSNVTISGNTAQDVGGGVRAQEDATLILDQCVLSANTAPGDGAGIYSEEANVTVKAGQIVSNTTDKSGGGIRIVGGTVSLDGTSITGNLAKEGGGGIYINRSHGVLNLKDCVIEENEAYDKGGGVFLGNNDGAEVTLSGRVIAENNKSTDIYLTEGKALHFKDTLTKETSVGVTLEKDEGTFTSGLKEHSDGHDPDTYFTAVKGYSVMADKKGEGTIVASEWPRLQQMIDRAPDSGGVITLDRDWEAVEKDRALSIPEGKEITIDLNGHVIDRNHKYSDRDGQAMTVSGTLTIRDSAGDGKITGGNVSDGDFFAYGGGIKNYGTLNLEGGEITGNKATDGGGGIYNDGILNIKGGAVTGNTGGGIHTRGDEMNMSGGVISNNICKDGFGGGMYCYSGNVTITGGKITSNEADYGGGIFLGGGHLKILGGEITSNRAYAGGGAISTLNTTYHILTLAGGTITDNEADVVGGGIEFSDNSALNVQGSPVVYGNKAPRAKNLEMDLTVKMNITDTLTENARVDIASADAAAALTSGLKGKASAETVAKVFSYNDRSDLLEVRDDGELYLKVKADTWVDTWEGLQDAVNDAKAGEVIALKADLLPEGKERILIKDRSLTLDLCGYRMIRERDFPVYDSNGRMLEIDGSSVVTIRDSANAGRISGGTTSGNGGAISIGENAKCTIDGCSVTDGKAGGVGGGIYVAGTLDMTGGLLYNSSSDDKGAGIYCAKGAKASLKDSKVFSNGASDDGGGIYNDGGTVVLNNVTIRDCTAEDRGAGIYNDGSTTITGGKIESNEGHAGAGLFTNSGQIVLDGVNLSNNTSDDYGGAIYGWDGDLTVRGCTITGNKAKKGGGGIIARGAANVSDSVFTSNTTDGSGGAMYMYNGMNTATNVRVIENVAEKSGGAVFITEGGGLDLSGTEDPASGEGSSDPPASTQGVGTVITGNKADAQGGAVSVSKSADAFSISGQLTIENNEAGKGKDVLLSSGRKLTLNGPLAEATRIHVSMEEKIEDVSPEFTSGFAQQCGEAKPSSFFLADDGYTVQRSENGEGVIAASEWPVLQEMIDQAKDGDTIVLEKDYKAVASEKALQISGKTLTIELDGHTLDRNRQKQQEAGEVIHVAEGAQLTIADSSGKGRITGGSGDSGGGIVNKGTLNFEGGTITGCKAAYGGGGIFSTGTLTISGGKITGNSATDTVSSGGGVYSDGALSITGGEISGNEAAGYGGGIYSNSGTLKISGGRIAENKATDGIGGGVYSYYGTVDVTGGEIAGNTAKGVGGGISLALGTAFCMEDGAIRDNHTDENGGGIFLGGTGTINGGTITGNVAAGSGGGLIVNSSKTTISGGTFSENKAAENGGAVYINDSGTLELFGAALQNNEAGSAGGGICVHADGELHTQNAPVVKGNQAPIGKNILLDDGSPIVITGKLAGDARLDVASRDTSRALTSGFKSSGSSKDVFSYNEEKDVELAEKEGELYLNVKADVWVSDWKALQDAINADENQGKVIALSKDVGAGGADRLLLDGRNVTVDLSGHTLDRQRRDSDANGHVFELDNGSTLTIRDTAGTGVITGGWANNGGAINIADDATCNIEGGTIRGNKAEDDGGGIYVYGTLNMTGGSVVANEADDNGGGIYLDEKSDPKADLENAVIESNASDDCGGLYVYGTAELKNVRIEDNTARKAGGGGINNKGKTTLTNCSIQGNAARDNGAGIYTEGTLTVTGGGIADNTGEHAGAGLFIDSGEVTLNTTSITGNAAPEDSGGAVYNKGRLTCSDCTITGNAASIDGGGIYTNGTFSMINGSITANKADASGGAVRIHGGTASFHGTTMTDNTSEKSGGAIYCNNEGSCELSGATISANKAKGNGGGLFVGDTSGTVSISGKLNIEQNEGSGNVYLCSGKKLTLSGALDKGTAIGVTMEKSDVDVPFTKDFYKYQQNADPAAYFVSDDDFAVCLLSGEAAMKADVDNEKSFIEKNSNIKDYGQLNPANWMAGISGERYLNEINIPGTHDSSMADPNGKGTPLGFYGNSFAKTQTRFIDEQLKDGIRSLDMRLINDYCKHDYIVHFVFEDDGKNLWTCHGKTSFGTYHALNHDGDLQSLDEVLGWVKSFLREHPTETLVIGFMAETKDDEAHDIIIARLKKILRKLSYETNPATGKPYIYMEDGMFGKQYTHYPKLKDCRGQFLIQADSEEDSLIIGGSTSDMFDKIKIERRDGNYEQDGHHIVDSVKRFYANYGDRPLPATADVHPTASDQRGYLYTIGLNGTGTENNILGLPIDPLKIAETIHDNLFGEGSLFDQRGYYLGWVNQDGEEKSFTRSIWDSNFFDSLEYCTVTVDPGFETDAFPVKTYRLLKNTEIKLPECIYPNPNAGGDYFEGWKAGDETYLADQTYKVTENVTFSACWGRNMHSPLRAVWWDAGNEDKLRPQTLQVKVRGETDPVTLSAEDGWKTMIQGDVDKVTPVWPERIIPTQEDPQGEDKAGQYRYEVSGNLGTGFAIQLFHTPEQTVPVSGTIAWEDGDDKEGVRPDSVTLRLFADGVEQQDIKVTKEAQWKWDLGERPKYKDGREISYTVTEDAIDEYIDEIVGLKVTNTHSANSRHVFLAGEIRWDDSDDALHQRPDKVTLHLQKDGKEIATKDVKPDEDGFWAWSFYVAADRNEDLATASFTVTQDAVPRYATAYKNDEIFGYLVVENTYASHEHQPAETVIENIVDPTCETEGSFDKVVYCSTCGQEISREKNRKAALGHDWGQWTVEKVATETEDGLEKRTCNNDASHTQTRKIPRIGHVHRLEEVKAKAATCTENGNIAYWICANGSEDECCYRYFSDEAAETEINELDVVVKALGHDWDEGEVTTKPGCISPGVRTYTCQREGCDATKEASIDPAGHKESDWEEKILLKPTCETKGYSWRTIHCTVCDRLLQWDTEIIDPIGHDWGEVSYEWSDDNSSVTAKRICKRDQSHVESETAITICEITKQPTVTEEGERIYTATFENKAFEDQIRKEVIDPTGGGSGGDTPTEYEIPVRNEYAVEVKASISDGNAVVSEISEEAIEKITFVPEGKEPVETITIDLSGTPKEVTSVELTKKTVQNLADAVGDDRNSVVSVTIKLTNASVEVDLATLASMVTQAQGGTIKLVVNDLKESDLNDSQRNVLKAYEDVRPFEICFESNGRKISDISGGTMGIKLAFAPEFGKDIDHYHIVYLNPDGTIQTYPTIAKADLIFTEIDHNSEYAVVYDATRENANRVAEYKAARAAAKAKKVTIRTAKVKKHRKVLVTWKKTSGISGYLVVYSTSKKFTKKTTRQAFAGAKAVNKTLKKLRAGKKYYVKIRPYTSIHNPMKGTDEKVYGKWSKVKRFKARR